ncbi:phage holin, partial [Enterobacter sp. AM17-18]
AYHLCSGGQIQCATSIGVIGSLLFGLLTFLTNLYFQIKADRRRAARGE